MGRSKTLLDKSYVSNGGFYNSPGDPILKDLGYFLKKIEGIAKPMHSQQETVGGKLVDYRMWGMDGGVVVYRMESEEGKKVLSRTRVIIWPNDDGSLPQLEAMVTPMLTCT